MYVRELIAIYDVFIDTQWTRCALTPLADVQHRCKIWLEVYFETYGDNDPTENITRISVIEKNDVYEKYKQVLLPAYSLVYLVHLPLRLIVY